MTQDWLNLTDYAAPGSNVTTTVQQLIANGAPAIYYGAGNWYQDDVDLTQSPGYRFKAFGDHPGKSLIFTTKLGASVFKFMPTTTVEAFMQFEDLQLLAGQGYAHNSQDGYGIVVQGPTGGEVAHGVYRNLWLKNFENGLRLIQHNDTELSDILAEYCHSGLVAIDCGDMDGVNIKAQGSSALGWGIQILGTPDGQASHRAEGCRLTNVSTNTQCGGLLVQNYQDFDIVNPSFTSAPGGGAWFDNASFGRVIGGEFQGGSGASAFTTLPNCVGLQFNAVMFYGSMMGLVLQGFRHTVSGCQGTGNAGSDMYVSAQNSAITGGNYWSDPPNGAVSIIEAGGADFNNFVGIMAKHGIVKIGPHSAVGNCLYG